MVLDPEKEAEAKAIFRKWGLDFAVIGKTTDTLRFVVRHGGEVKADLPIKELGDEAPLYDRPHRAARRSRRKSMRPRRCTRRSPSARRCKSWSARPDSARNAGSGSSTTSSFSAIACSGPGGDAAVVRIGDGPKGLALTTDVTPRYCYADPVRAASRRWPRPGAISPPSAALPLALTDNLNFGNPEKPEIMGQFVGCLEGIGEACRALDFPIVSGNVSLYNETQRQGHPADPGDRRRRPRRGCQQDRGARLRRRGRRDRADRRERGLARPVALSARNSAAARKARRRRSISPRNGATAISSAR